jgi:putative sigma-54 modulation protein
MQISTTARHCELDAKVRTFAQQRLAKLERFARDIQEARLTITAEKFRHTAEINLRLKHREMASREQADTPHAAIELAAQRLEQQLRRLKDRRTEHKRPGRDLPAAPGGDAAEPGFDDEPDFRSGTED